MAVLHWLRGWNKHGHAEIVDHELAPAAQRALELQHPVLCVLANLRVVMRKSEQEMVERRETQERLFALPIDHPLV